MTTGDEPMLPQPSDDNAPMISGRGTKVIADARGAYLAGNLWALLKRLNEAQQIKFRRAIVNQTIWYTQDIMRRNSVELSTAYYRVFEEISHWVNTPRIEIAVQIFEALLNGGLIPTDTPEDTSALALFKVYDELAAILLTVYYCIREPKLQIAAIDAESVVIRAFGYWDWTIEPDGSHLDVFDADVNEQEARRISRQWQVEAAWAILQGHDLPPLPELPS
jgi:hypothetical protein